MNRPRANAARREAFFLECFGSTKPSDSAAHSPLKRIRDTVRNDVGTCDFSAVSFLTITIAAPSIFKDEIDAGINPIVTATSETNDESRAAESEGSVKPEHFRTRYFVFVPKLDGDSFIAVHASFDNEPVGFG